MSALGNRRLRFTRRRESSCVRDGRRYRLYNSGQRRRHVLHENPADDRYMSPVVRCDGCGRDYDTDASATTLMLARAVAPASPDEGAPRDRVTCRGAPTGA
jgi:hypothetical protein